jgi:enolase-phosphatase E1
MRLAFWLSFKGRIAVAESLMNQPLREKTVAILLDIEGTTTPISFVYDTLFPYARANVKDFLSRALVDESVRQDVGGLRAEHAADVRRGLAPPPLEERTPEDLLESMTAYVHWLMDQDRKSTPLKSLQGKIWEEGYRAGRLRGEVFADVPAAFERWRRDSTTIAIYSSGSVLAQRLLFSHTVAGDLTGFINAYFDTRVGAKKEPVSYRRIAEELGLRPAAVLFVSDIVAELDAARAAGMQTALSVRPGNHPQPSDHTHPVIHTFAEL